MQGMLCCIRFGGLSFKYMCISMLMSCKFSLLSFIEICFKSVLWVCFLKNKLIMDNFFQSFFLRKTNKIILYISLIWFMILDSNISIHTLPFFLMLYKVYTFFTFLKVHISIRFRLKHRGIVSARIYMS